MISVKCKLHTKLLALALIPVFTISIAMMLYFVSVRVGDIETLMKEKATAIAEQIAAKSVNALFIRDRSELVKNVLDDFTSYEDLLSVTIESSNSDFLFKHKVKNITSPYVSATALVRLRVIDDPLGDFGEVEEKIENSDSVIGHITITLIDSSHVQKSEIFQTSILLILVILSITTLVVFPMSKKMTEPIQKLVAAFNALGHGDFKTKVNEESTDELLELQQGFNQMSIALSRQNEELNDQVHQVTNDLQTTLQTLEIQYIELDITRKQALESSRIKSEFLANMSHEIRTPMNGIVGFTELLGKTQLSDSQQQYLQTIKQSANNLLQILNDILDFSKLESGKIEIHNYPFVLEDCLADVINIFTPLAHEKKLDLIPAIYSDVPKEVIGDRLRLTQILNNLISNAIKFTQQGEVIIRVMLENQQDNNSLISFSVSDTGMGLSDEDQKTLFKPFRQIHTDLNRGFGGTGLGLSICRSLSEIMGGHIVINSEINKGSTFIATIPFQNAEDSDSHIIKIKPFQDKNLLLISSNHLSKMSLLNMFSEFGFNIKTEDYYTNLTSSSFENIDYLVIALLQSEISTFESNFETYLGVTNIPGILLLPISDQKYLENYTNKFGLITRQNPTFSRQMLKELKKLENKEFIPSKSSLSEISLLNLKPINILIVDDNEINQSLLSALLDDTNINITLAYDGLEAINLYKENTFDLIFMDIHMPNLNGIDATSELRNSGCEIPIIALTADVAYLDKEKIHRYGFNDVIIKPVSTSHLTEILSQLFDDNSDSKVTYSQPVESLAIENRSIKIRDIDQALRIAGGMETVADKLLNQLIEQLPDYFESLHEMVAAQDWEQLWQILHKLHGASAVCGVPALNIAVALLQVDIKNKDYMLIPSNLKNLEEEFEKLLDFVNENLTLE